jgi:hypothetical protein
MTRAEALLDTLGRWQPAGPGPHSLSAELGPNAAATLTAERADELSVLLAELTVSGPEGAGPCTPGELTRRAVDTAARLTGALEPLSLYEVDSTRAIALLRSATPTVRGNQVTYYELTLAGRHAANPKRFRAAREGGTPRQPVSFPLTHESVVRVVEALGPGMLEAK